MPFQVGGIATHDDIQHTGSAKRDGPGGVAPVDATKLVPDANIPSAITRDTELTDHAAVTKSVHNFDADGNAPAQAHNSSKHTGATGNLLVGRTPTFSGWSTNPGTDADIIDELTDTLTTSGQIAASNTGTILYNLGSSKRIIVYMALTVTTGALDSADVTIRFSDDNTTFYKAGEVHGSEGENVKHGSFIAFGKAKYVKYVLLNQASAATLKIKCRIYAIN